METGFRSAMWALACMLLVGCATTTPGGIHCCLTESPRVAPPKTFLLLPVKIAVSELGVGSVEEVPEWSEAGTCLVERFVRETIQGRSGMRLVDNPQFSEEEKSILDQHTALYDMVAGTAFSFRNVPAWEHKRKRPDYTIGNGLAYLSNKAEADAAIFVTGEDYVSSGGRKAAFVLAALFGAITPMGHSQLHAGIVDLRTGNVLWSNTAVSEDWSLKSESGAKTMVDHVFGSCPDFAKFER